MKRKLLIKIMQEPYYVIGVNTLYDTFKTLPETHDCVEDFFLHYDGLNPLRTLQFSIAQFYPQVRKISDERCQYRLEDIRDHLHREFRANITESKNAHFLMHLDCVLHYIDNGVYAIRKLSEILMHGLEWYRSVQPTRIWVRLTHVDNECCAPGKTVNIGKRTVGKGYIDTVLSVPFVVPFCLENEHVENVVVLCCDAVRGAFQFDERQLEDQRDRLSNIHLTLRNDL